MTARLIGLGGRLRAGKDTVADVLVEHHGFRKMGMSDALADALYVLDPVIPTGIRYSAFVRRVGYVEAKKNPEVRRLLQKLGTEVGRDMIGTNVWVDIIEARIRASLAAGIPVAVTGIRFPNEVTMIHRVGGTLVWVSRPEADNAAPAHASETSVNVAHFDIDMQNDGTLDELVTRAHRLANVPAADDEALPPPMFDLGDGPRSSGWYGGTE
jgi:hypothetical protein